MLNGFWRKSFEANNIRFYVAVFLKKKAVSKTINFLPLFPFSLHSHFLQGHYIAENRFRVIFSRSLFFHFSIFACFSLSICSWSFCLWLFLYIIVTITFLYRKIDLPSAIFILSVVNQRQLPWFANVFASLTKRVKSIIKISTFIHNFFAHFCFHSFIYTCPHHIMAVLEFPEKPNQHKYIENAKQLNMEY